ncbi:unnamed protein product [Calypogeia fissa]
METNNYSGAFERRVGSEKEPNAMEDGRDANRDEGRSVHRFEGKVMRKKRGLRDVNAADKSQKHLSKFKRISERDNSPERVRDGERRHGGHFSGKELSWKEIAERKQGRHRILNGNGSGDKGADGSGKGLSARKGRFGKGGKTQSGNHFRGGLKGGEGKSFPAKRKHSSEFGAQNGDGKRKKSSEPVKKRRQRLILQDHSDDDDYYVRPLPVKKDPNPSETRAGEGKEAEKETDPDVAARVGSAGQADQGAVRKSSRVPKRKVLEDFEDDVPDVGVQKSGRRKQSDVDGKSDTQESESNGENGAGASRVSSDSDADAEDWNDEMDSSSKPKQAKKTLDLKSKSAPLTARQRSLQLANVDGEANGGLNLIEFPDGLSHFSRRGTTKLSLEDRQAKKAEAASRRKQVVEKAAKEQQATAIQKILGQDSTRRKKEERLQKQREEIQQEKKAAAMETPSNSIRWTFGPQGTTVSWSEDAKLPEMFCAPVNAPPLQQCAAPSCTNPRKYRDSKSSLPLCSLQCYRVINLTAGLVST